MWAAGRSLFGIHFMTWRWKYILHLDGAGITDESVQLRVIKYLQNKVCIKQENLNLMDKFLVFEKLDSKTNQSFYKTICNKVFGTKYRPLVYCV